jgi:hypothetical protein
LTARGGTAGPGPAAGPEAAGCFGAGQPRGVRRTQGREGRSECTHNTEGAPPGSAAGSHKHKSEQQAAAPAAAGAATAEGPPPGAGGPAYPGRRQGALRRRGAGRGRRHWGCRGPARRGSPAKKVGRGEAAARAHLHVAPFAGGFRGKAVPCRGAARGGMARWGVALRPAHNRMRRRRRAGARPRERPRPRQRRRAGWACPQERSGKVRVKGFWTCTKESQRSCFCQL